MTMPDELERWLTARFEREREATLTLVLKMLENILNETLRHNGEALGKELEQQFSKVQATLDRMLSIIDLQADRIDRVVRGEPLDDRMN
jgi:DNA-binding transcriptional regulator GbsR (MarR family)